MDHAKRRNFDGAKTIAEASYKSPREVAGCPLSVRADIRTNSCTTMYMS